MTRPLLIVALAALTVLAACAETDPYRRLDPAPTAHLTAAQAACAFDVRWPQRFKCVHNVTIDFGPQTRALVGYLIVDGTSFRLQGMTEQGIKLFDIIQRLEDPPQVVMAAEQFDKRIVEAVARDIARVFARKFALSGERKGSAAHALDGTELVVQQAGIHDHARLVGDPPRVDWYRQVRDGSEAFRVDQYEWRELGGQLRPSVIVLRDRGRESNGPSYKLTIQITEFEVRDTPWPERTFRPGD